jgi:hypothetical protein
VHAAPVSHAYLREELMIGNNEGSSYSSQFQSLHLSKIFQSLQRLREKGEVIRWKQLLAITLLGKNLKINQVACLS